MVVYTDASWETKYNNIIPVATDNGFYNQYNFCRFSWLRTSTILGRSRATVTWTIPSDVVPGTYRIRHFGHYKDFNFYTSSECVQI